MSKQNKIKKRSQHKDKELADIELCMTRGQLLNIVLAAEDQGHKDAKKKIKPPKCCPKAKKFVKQLKKRF